MFYHYYWSYISCWVYFNNDVLSFLFVAGGSVGYGLLKNQNEKFILNCGNGAVYFGWFGTLIGLIALTAGKWENWGDIDKTSKSYR